MKDWEILAGTFPRKDMKLPLRLGHSHVFQEESFLESLQKQSKYPHLGSYE